MATTRIISMHIIGAFKEANILLPAHAASAMLQADELLLHLSSAVGTNLITGSHNNIPVQPSFTFILSYLCGMRTT